MVGQNLAHYKVLEEISRGGMGIVYKALDVKLNREVALKVLPPELVSDPDRKRRFVQEAQAAAALKHPNIGVIYEIDEVDGVDFIAMELIEGDKLGDVLKRGPLPSERAIEIAIEVADGLADAHDRGIVHRDLKPGNVMITRKGHAKIIDFGLAKLMEGLTADSAAPTTPSGETHAGEVMGTFAYMSPEQARGEKVDHRSDIFSFGVLLHELLTGKLPRDSGAKASDCGTLQPVVERCLAMAPEDRYQNMPDVVSELRGVFRKSEVSSGRYAIAVGIVAALAVLAAYLLIDPKDDPSTPPSRPSVAVLYFDNNTGDASYDWLRTGLADLLITDLSQSGGIDVLSTDRVYEILSHLGRVDEPITSFDTVEEIAESANVRTVVLGSFIKAGETFRISARLQDAAGGEILASEQVEGVGEESIFPMVDELTRRIKDELDIGAAADRNVQELTTSSPEAYRFFAQGDRLGVEDQVEEAIVLYQRAVEIDPGFAYALSSLSIQYWKLGDNKREEEYAQRATEHAARLPPRERYYVEGTYHASVDEGIGTSLDSYRKALEADPYQYDARNDLAWAYRQLELHHEAIEQAQILLGQNETYWLAYNKVAHSLSALGRQDEATALVRDRVRKDPGRGFVHLGQQLTRVGRLDEADRAFDDSRSLRSERRYAARWDVAVLREDWRAAEGVMESLRSSSRPSDQWRGLQLAAITMLFQGRSRQAQGRLEEATRSPEQVGNAIARSWNTRAHLFLEMGDAAAALAAAETAQLIGTRNFEEWNGIYFVALAQAKLNRWSAAEETADLLRQKADSLPGPRWERRHRRLLGELDLIRGDVAGAIAHLERAQELLSPRGVKVATGEPQHVPVWFSLASAYRSAGQDEKALEWLTRVTEATTEHTPWPIPYVRSFYLVAEIHEKAGRSELARASYERFLDFWGDGDLDRKRVEEALNKISLSGL